MRAALERNNLERRERTISSCAAVVSNPLNTQPPPRPISSLRQPSVRVYATNVTIVKPAESQKKICARLQEKKILIAGCIFCLVVAIVVGLVLIKFLSTPDAAFDTAKLKFVSNELNGLLGQCEGNCDTNVDCDTNLVCFQREDGGGIPGCKGDPMSDDYDYCIRPQDIPRGRQSSSPSTISPTTGSTFLPTTRLTLSPNAGLTYLPTYLRTTTTIIQPLGLEENGFCLTKKGWNPLATLTPGLLSQEQDEYNDEGGIDELVLALTEKLEQVEGIWYSDDFYEPHGRELVKVSATMVGHTLSALVAVKITGDPNVPSGYITWKTLNWPGLGGSYVPVEVQVRGDTTDPHGFSWITGSLSLVSKDQIVLSELFTGTFHKQNKEENELTKKLEQVEGIWYSDDFYEPHGREWVKVSATMVGHTLSALVAIKITGDPNVPSGCITWKTLNWPGLGGSYVPVEVQVRGDTTDPHGFSWITGSLSLASKDQIVLSGPFTGTFHKHNKEEGRS